MIYIVHFPTIGMSLSSNGSIKKINWSSWSSLGRHAAIHIRQVDVRGSFHRLQSRPWLGRLFCLPSERAREHKDLATRAGASSTRLVARLPLRDAGEPLRLLTEAKKRTASVDGFRHNVYVDHLRGSQPQQATRHTMSRSQEPLVCIVRQR